jgi:hypothetical protein
MMVQQAILSLLKNDKLLEGEIEKKHKQENPNELYCKKIVSDFCSFETECI